MADVTFGGMSYVWRVLFVLALLSAFAYWARRRWGVPGPGAENRRRLRIVESLALGPQRHVHVIGVGDRHYLIGVTSQTITLLAAVDGAGEEKGGADADGDGRRSDSPPPDFQTVLKQAEGGTPTEDTLQ